MQSTKYKLTLSIIFCMTVCLCFTSICRGVEYEYTEMLPPGWIEAGPSRINNNDTVAGWGYDSTGAERGFLYSGGVYTEILPPGWSEALATGINDNGVVIGGLAAFPPTLNKAFIYSEGTYTELLPPGWSSAYARSINNNGDVAGYGYDSTGISKGFIYKSGVYTELLPTGWINADACSINDNGDVAGYGDDGTTYKGFIYSGGVYTELLPPGVALPYPADINNNGVVVGYDGIPIGVKGFLYSGGVYTEILPPGFISAFPGGINDSGAFVGRGFDGTTNKGFVYSAGVYTEILPSGWMFIFTVDDINNNGVVVGSGYDSKAVLKGFIATPKAPPSCGDGTCNGTETCSTCPQDCGECPPEEPLFCARATVKAITLHSSCACGCAAGNDTPTESCKVALEFDFPNNETANITADACGTQINLALLKAFNFKEDVYLCLYMTWDPAHGGTVTYDIKKATFPVGASFPVNQIGDVAGIK